MNIASTTSFSAGQAARGPQRPNQQETLAAALKTVGVDDETATDVLSQVQVAVDSVKSDSSASATQSAIRSAVEGVLQANGIDPAEVGEAIQASRPTGGPQGSGRKGGPGGPPPPPRSDEGSSDEVGSVESALLSANVDEADVDELITQLVDAISELTSNETSQVSNDAVRTALTKVLEENGVDVELFEQSLQEQLGSTGSFFDRVA